MRCRRLESRATEEELSPRSARSSLPTKQPRPGLIANFRRPTGSLRYRPQEVLTLLKTGGFYFALTQANGDCQWVIEQNGPLPWTTI